MDAKEKERDWPAFGREVIEIEIAGLTAVRDRLNAAFTQALKILANCEGRVVVTGVGKSGLVGRKIAATLSSTGTPSFFLHPVEGVHGDLGMIRSGDVVLALSNSGETEELSALIPALKALDVRIVGLTGNTRSTLGLLCDAVINTKVPKEACPMGLAPTASTTAALAVGDALAASLIQWKSFSEKDFQLRHPGGVLGGRLRRRVQDLMHTENIPVAGSDVALDKALELLDKGGLGALALLDANGALAGILTDGDVRRLLCKGPVDRDAPVAEAMTRNPKSAQPSASAAEVLDIMEERAITVIPIVDQELGLVGMIHLHDLLGKGVLKFAG